MAKQSLEAEAVTYFASRSHNAWRKQFARTNPDQADQPRLRMRGGKMVDINQPWDRLDPAAQADNRVAAEIAYAAVKRHPKNREKAAAFVHADWVERNRNDPNQAKELFQPYAALPEIEKDKDRAHVDRMKKALAAVRKDAKRAKKRREKALRNATLALDPIMAGRLQAAAAALSQATGRDISAEALLAAGAEAVLSICEAAAPAKGKKKR
jgi:hypothetical protein